MMDALAGVGADVCHDAVATLEALFARDALDEGEDLTEKFAMFIAEIANRSYVLFRHHEDMGRGSRIDVTECEHTVGLGYDVRVQVATYDPAKQAILSHNYPLPANPSALTRSPTTSTIFPNRSLPSNQTRT